MSDVRTVFRDWAGDWLISGPQLAEDDGLESAVVMSLFTDRLAEGDSGGPRRGWWGDTYADVPGDQIGSRLWLLAREKQLPAVLVRVEDYATEALQWLIDDGVAAAVDAQASFPGRGLLGVLITVSRRDGTRTALRFQWTWQQLTS
jgi:phage gp46-like protein